MSAIEAATLRSRSSLLRDVGLLGGRNVRLAMVRDQILMMVVFPLMFFAGFMAVLHKLLRAQGIDSAQFVPPAIIAQAMMFTAMSTAFFCATDRRSGLLARCRSLPIHASAFPLARLVVDAMRATVSTIVIVGAGWALGFRFHGGAGGAIVFLIVAVGFSLSLAAGTAAIGLASDDPEAVSAMLVAPYMLLLNLSDAFVPVSAFPGWLQPVVRASPVTSTIDAMRSLAAGHADSSALWHTAAWIAGCSVVFGLAATRAFRKAT